jgi:hypothetical protein
MNEDMEYESDLALEGIRGGDKKPKMTILNQKKVSKWELDELMGDDFAEES